MNNKHLTPVWIVYVDGQRLDIAHEGALQRIVVDDKLNDVGLATLEFDTSYLQVRDAGTFWLESEVSVHLGYKDDCQQVFVGEVTEFIQEYKEYGHQRLKVVCKNCLHRLQNAHQALSFEFKTLSEALVSRLESYGIKAQVDSFGTKKYFVESQITDYEFLMESANKYGKTVYAHGNKVYVKDEVTICNEDVVLEWGKSLVSFRGRESLKGQISSCSFVGWDSRRRQGITGRVSLGEVPVKVGGGRSWEDNSKAAGGRWHSTIMEESLRDREEAVVLAKAYLQNLSMQYQMAECKCEGDQRILPGMRVTVKYVGESYSGEYIANHVIHEFSVYGGYTTTLYLKRNMAGGEKKRVSPIDSEMMRERLRRMEERMHGPVEQEQVAVYEEEVEPAATGEVVMNIRKAIEKFSGHKYITADAATGQQEFRCDNFVEAVLDDAGHNPQDYMSGKATEKNVQNHIENALAKGRTSKNARSNAPNLPNGAYVVYMNESSKGYDPHVGIIIIDADSVIYTDNSSGNVNKGVSSTRYNSVQAFQSDYGYSNFYYQKIE